MLEKTANWKKSKERELKLRIQKLADKIVWVTADIMRFGPRKRGKFKRKRKGLINHWYRMSQVSLRATRKKIYKLQAELQSL